MSFQTVYIFIVTMIVVQFFTAPIYVKLDRIGFWITILLITVVIHLVVALVRKINNKHKKSKTFTFEEL